MENVLEPKEAFNLFKVPSKLENIVTALMVSIISNDEKRMNEAIETADFFALELTANEIGNTIKKKEETHKMAEANKAFAHFRY